MKAAFARLRETLDPEDRTLLLLRIDSRMPWEEVARILSDAETPLAAAVLRKRAAALRQRFSRVKAQLREKAKQKACSKPIVDRRRARLAKPPQCEDDRGAASRTEARA